MQLRIGISRSILYQPPDNLVDGLISAFTYENSSVKYQLFRHRSNKSNIIRKLLHTVAMNETEAIQMWRDELIRLERGSSVSLLTPTPDGLIVFPTGLLSKILAFFGKNGLNVDEIKRDCIVDLRKRPAETQGFAIQGKPAKLRPYQEEAVRKLIDAEQGTFAGATGCGKTLVIQEVIRRLGHRTLLVVPSISILKQTVKRFEKYFGNGAVGQFGGGKKLGNKLRKITVACAPSVAKSDSELWKGVDLLIHDESHHLSAATLGEICYKVVPQAFYRLNFTATNFRNDGSDLALEAAGFPAVFEYSVEDGIREGYLAKPKFLIYNVGFNSFRNYSGDLPVYMYKYHVIRNDKLTVKIAKMAEAVVRSGKQVLIMVKEKFHGYALVKLIPGAVFVRDDKKDDKGCFLPDPEEAVLDFNTGKIRCLLSTSICGEGTDIQSADVLINLFGGKSKLEVLQTVGRGLRKTATKSSLLVIDFVHATHPTLERHSKERIKVYRKLGDVEVVDLNA